MENNMLPETPPVIPPKPKLNPLVVVLSLLVLLIFSVGAFILGIYSVSNKDATIQSSIIPSNKPTSKLSAESTVNWISYTNTEYGFEIKHHPSIFPAILAEGTSQLVLISFGTIKNNGYEVEISEQNNTEYYKYQLVDHSIVSEIREDKIIVDNISSVILRYNQALSADKVNMSKVIINNNNLDYIVTSLSDNIDQILASFRFLDPAPATGIENWETYTGNKFAYSNNVYSGYSFNFPSSCKKDNENLNCILKNSTAIIWINAGGHGGEDRPIQAIRGNELKIVPAGEGRITEIEYLDDMTISGTFWINKTEKLTQEPIFGFEFSKISIQDQQEFEKLFDQILSTFKFLE